MLYSLIFIALNAAGGWFFTVEKLYFWISLVPLAAILLITLKHEKFDKLTTLVLFLSAVLTLIGSIRDINSGLFLVLYNTAAFVSSVGFLSGKKIFYLFSWIINGASIGFLVSQIRGIPLGVLFGILIFFTGFRYFTNFKIPGKLTEK